MMATDERVITERRLAEITPRNSAGLEEDADTACAVEAHALSEALDTLQPPEPPLTSELGVLAALTVALEEQLVLPPPEPVLMSKLAISIASMVEAEQGPMPPGEPTLSSVLGLRCALTIALEEGSVPPPEPILVSELGKRCAADISPMVERTAKGAPSAGSGAKAFPTGTHPAAARKLQCF